MLPLQGMEVGTGTHRDTPVILVKQSSRPLAENLVSTFKYGKVSSKPEPTYVDVYCLLFPACHQKRTLVSWICDIPVIFEQNISLASLIQSAKERKQVQVCNLLVVPAQPHHTGQINSKENSKMNLPIKQTQISIPTLSRSSLIIPH